MAGRRSYLTKLVEVQKCEASLFKSRNGRLETKRTFGHAMCDLAEKDATYSMDHMLAEVHQLLRHGHECIAGQLLWTLVALHRNVKVCHLCIYIIILHQIIL